MGKGQSVEPAAPPLAGSTLKPQKLKVLTLNFNSEVASTDHQSRLRDLRFQAILDWIAIHDPDVILMQEAWNFHNDPSVAQSIARAAGYDVTYNIGMGFPGIFWDGDAILAKKKYHMAGTRTWTLQPSSPYLGDGKSWVIELGSVTYGLIGRLTLEDGKPVYVVDTHLIGATAQDRDQQTADLLLKVKQSVEDDGVDFNQAKIILGGDLNSSPTDLLNVRLKDAGFVDTWEQLHPGVPNPTDCSDPTQREFNPMSIAVSFPDQSDEDSDDPSDYLFYRGQRLVGLGITRVFTVPFEGVWMSDHYGLVATYGVNDLSPVPNPVEDPVPTLPQASLFHVTREMFSVTENFLDIEVDGPRGLVLVNNLDDELDIRIETGGRTVFSDSHSELKSGHSVAFVFTEPGEYPVFLKNINGDRVFGIAHYSPRSEPQ